MGWADNVMLAMAPIGVIAVVVSAIRVGGPTWLKAIVGRARENRAVPEAELMSSTSDEVCELWSGNGLVKVMGVAPIRAFMCLFPCDDSTNGARKEMVVLDLQSAVAQGVLEVYGKSSHPWPISPVRAGFVSILREHDLANYLVTRRLDPSIAKRLRKRWVSIFNALKKWLGQLTERPRAKSDEEGQARNDEHAGDTDSGNGNDNNSSRDGGNNGSEDATPSSKFRRAKIIVIQDTSKGAPNISLNAHSRRRPVELWSVAALGCALQLGVLGYGAFAANSQSTAFLTDGEPAPEYAYPCLAAGTVMLVAGMLMCAHVVESGSQEVTYQVKLPGTMARFIWLQKEGTVNDQSFRPFAIYSPSPTRYYTTSRRREDGDGSQSVMEAKTASGTIISLLGFVTQFIGLRGIHWSVSVAQLGAALVMAVMRAWVRRGLAKPPCSVALDPGHELDWMVMTLGRRDRDVYSDFGCSRVELDDAASQDRSSSSSERSQSDSGSSEADVQTLSSGERDWEPGTTASADITEAKVWDGRIVTARDRSHLPRVGVKEYNLSGVPPSSAPDPKCNAQRIMMLRRDLGRISNWPGPASQEAVSVARSIEAVWNDLYRLGVLRTEFEHRDLAWSLPTSDGGSVTFRLSQSEPGFFTPLQAFADEIDAVLSLWLYSVPGRLRNSLGYGGDRTETDTWLRGKEASWRPQVRILAPDTPEMRRSIRWWAPYNVGVEDLGDLLPLGPNYLDPNWIVGSGPASPINQVAFAFPQIQYERDPETAYAAVLSRAVAPGEYPTGGPKFLVTMPRRPLQLLYAQDLFSAFMWILSSSMAKSIPGDATFPPPGVGEPDTYGSNTRPAFRVQNPHVAELAQAIEGSGLGSLGEAYHFLIPPLTMRGRLPLVDIEALVGLARTQAKPHEKLERWDEAADVYQWLSQISRSYTPQPDHLPCLLRCGDCDKVWDSKYRAMAVFVEFLRAVTLAAQMRGAPSQLCDVQSRLERELREHGENFVEDILSLLGPLYQRQFRQWASPALPQLTSYKNHFSSFSVSRSEVDDEEWAGWQGYTDAMEIGSFEPDGIHGSVLRFTRLHEMASLPPEDRADFWAKHDLVRKYANRKDIYDWTPLHYAAAAGQLSNLRALIDLGGDVNARDLAERTPLHYACSSVEGGDVSAPYSDVKPPSTDDLRSCAEGLLRAGAEFNAQGRDGTTPLHCAAKAGLLEVVVLLVRERADLDARDASGRTPLIWATYHGHYAIVESLITARASLSLRTWAGISSLDIAKAEGGHERIAELLERGGDGI